MAAEQKAQPAAQSSGSGMDPKLAILLCWLFSPLAGIIFALTEKENYRIKLHAWQSILYTVGGGILVSIISAVTLGFGSCIVVPVYLIIPIVAIVKAWNGEDWLLPLIGEWAKEQASK